MTSSIYLHTGFQDQIPILMRKTQNIKVSVAETMDIPRKINFFPCFMSCFVALICSVLTPQISRTQASDRTKRTLLSVEFPTEEFMDLSGIFCNKLSSYLVGKCFLDW
jgi:hypothetical protein